MSRITPDNITNLDENEIFVFGSNTAGRHGKGAAKTALKWGAKFGQGEGLSGKTYAIPTVNSSITQKLPRKKIKNYIKHFLEFAKNHPELTFLVTEIGCGLAGYKVKDIAPLFSEAKQISNVNLPRKFWKKIQ